MELRPLGFGEIFDRAVTLYIRNLVPFVGIVMVLVLPLSIMQYFLDRDSQPQFDYMIRVFQHPVIAQSARPPSALASPSALILTAVAVFVAFLIWPFALNAVAVGVACLYRAKPVEFRTCYELVLRRWSQILAMIFIQLLVLLGWYLAVILVVVAIVFLAALFGTLVAGFAFWFGFIAAILAFLIMIPLLAPLLVALTFANYATVIEERGVINSVTLGFARVFNRAEFWRAWLFAIAAGAVVIGASMMFAIFSLLAAFAHLPALEAFIDALPRAVISPFGVVLLAVYYFDVRIRREGFDLEASLERLGGPQIA